jgi:hypothetical protein
MKCRSIPHRRAVSVVQSVVGVTWCLLMGFSADARAQTGRPFERAPFSPESAGEAAARRPFRGLFGADPSAGARQNLDLHASLFGAYDDNVVSALRGDGAGDPRLQHGGYYTGANAAMTYAFQGDRASFTATGATTISYYRQFDDPVVPSYSGAIGFSAPLGSRASVRASQSVQYSRFLGFGLFPLVPSLVLSDVDVAPPTHDFASGALTGFSYTTTADVQRVFGPRATLSAFYNLQRSTFNVPEYGLSQQRVGVRFERRVTTHAGIRLGYAHRVGDYGFVAAARPHRSHDLDVGLDYGRSLSFSRRTVLSFSTGSSILVSDDRAPDGSAISDAAERRTDFHVTGLATLNHEIGRSWTARASYVRSLRFVEVFSEPVFSDAVTASVDGQINRVLSANMTASYSGGSVGQRLPANDFGTFAAVAQLQAALTRHLAAYAEYLFYQYSVGSGVQLPVGFARALDRSGVRAGLNVWVPLLRGRRQ